MWRWFSYPIEIFNNRFDFRNFVNNTKAQSFYLTTHLAFYSSPNCFENYSLCFIPHNNTNYYITSRFKCKKYSGVFFVQRGFNKISSGQDSL